MADDGAPDYRTPSPDAGHEAIRGPLAQAIDDLSAAVEQLQVHDAQLDAALALTIGAYNFAQTALTNFTGLQAAITEQAAALTDALADAQQAIAELTGRVAALETPPLPAPPDPTPAV